MLQAMLQCIRVNHPVSSLRVRTENVSHLVTYIITFTIRFFNQSSDVITCNQRNTDENHSSQFMTVSACQRCWVRSAAVIEEEQKRLSPRRLKLVLTTRFSLENLYKHFNWGLFI